MRRFLLPCLASLLLYVGLCAFWLDRPISLGLLRLEMSQKLTRAATLASPKLVILAGSNAPYSHSCAVIGAMLDLPCENGGVAVGIGLDDLFARWAPLLHKGDILYLPMEAQQYTTTRAENRVGPDAALLLRHNRAQLRHLPPDRIIGAAFATSLPDIIDDLAEMGLARAGIGTPTTRLAGQFDVMGDRQNTPLSQADPGLLALLHRREPSAAALRSSYGARLIAAFVARESARGIIVIGGLPTDFIDIPIPPASIAAMEAAYTSHGGLFLRLDNLSRYERADFFDSQDHLAGPCQIYHSIKIAAALAALLHRPLNPPSPAAAGAAASCPGQARPDALTPGPLARSPTISAGR
jgi:hypothetical protein